MITFTLSPSALERVSELLSFEKPGTALRISIVGKGCSGLSYEFALDTSFKTDEDLVLFENGIIKVITDLISAGFLEQCTLDYEKSGFSSILKVINPNATATCGCGNSFSV